MSDTLDGQPRILDWSEGSGYEATAPDGTRYSLLDDWSRGERRWWWFRVLRPGEQPRGDRYTLPIDEREPWQQFEGSTNKQTVRNRAERHARLFHSERRGSNDRT